MAIDLTYQNDEVDIPIDALVLDIATINDGEDEIGNQSWAVGKERILGGWASIFQCMFGHEDFKLAYTIFILK